MEDYVVSAAREWEAQESITEKAVPSIDFERRRRS